MAESMKMTFVGQFFSLFTPSRLGELVKAKYVSELGALKALSSVVMDRIVDLIALLLLGVLAILYFKNIPIGFVEINIYMIAIFFIAALVLLFIFRKKIIEFKEKIFFERLDKKYIAFMFLLSLVIWIFVMLQVYLIALALNLAPNILDVIFMSFIITIIQLLPITVASIGLREWAGVTFLPLVGFSQAHALLGLWLVMLSLTIFPAIVGYVCFLKGKKKSN